MVRNEKWYGIALHDTLSSLLFVLTKLSPWFFSSLFGFCAALRSGRSLAGFPVSFRGGERAIKAAPLFAFPINHDRWEHSTIPRDGHRHCRPLCGISQRADVDGLLFDELKRALGVYRKIDRRLVHV